MAFKAEVFVYPTRHEPLAEPSYSYEGVADPDLRIYMERFEREFIHGQDATRWWPVQIGWLKFADTAKPFRVRATEIFSLAGKAKDLAVLPVVGTGGSGRGTAAALDKNGIRALAALSGTHRLTQPRSRIRDITDEDLLRLAQRTKEYLGEHPLAKEITIPDQNLQDQPPQQDNISPLPNQEQEFIYGNVPNKEIENSVAPKPADPVAIYTSQPTARRTSSTHAYIRRETDDIDDAEDREMKNHSETSRVEELIPVLSKELLDTLMQWNVEKMEQGREGVQKLSPYELFSPARSGVPVDVSSVLVFLYRALKAYNGDKKELRENLVRIGDVDNGYFQTAYNTVLKILKERLPKDTLGHLTQGMVNNIKANPRRYID